jgi:putative Holliday junction resolvase
MALDYGSARCGCAVSDPTGVLATPLDPVLAPAGKKGMGQLLALIRELGAERVVVGLPLSLDGGDSDQTREARDFAALLGRRLKDIPVELYDERFTTRLAQRDGGSRASEDSRAAAHLLSSWLDRHADA